MRLARLAALVAVTLVLGVSAARAEGAGHEGRPGWRLVWNDEFDGTALDATKWRARTTPEYHPLGDTDFSDARRHLRVEDGVLKLVARRGPLGRYTSAMVETQDIAAWRQGRFEARIKVPRGRGSNAAFWMMHRDPTREPWPLGGEIDIVEQLGRQPNRIYGTLHFKGAERIQRGGTVDAAEPYHEDFHVFAVEWTETGFAWFVDGEEYFALRDLPPSDPARPQFPFDRPFFMMLSNVIGGKWPGPAGFFGSFPRTMEIDWVRVYQRSEDQFALGALPRDETTR